MTYKIEYLKKVVKRDIPNLSTSARIRIKRTIEERLATDPIAYGQPLRYALHGQRRLRVGSYRIIYTVSNEDRIVTIIAIGHRKAVYD